MRYDAIIIDSNNFAYRAFGAYRKESPSFISKKQVFKNAVRNFIGRVEELRETYLHSDGTIFLLFDNPTSRIDLQSSFYFADRKQAYAKYKSDRAKEPKEFYSSLGLLKYYYSVSAGSYCTLQIPRLEADDLVEPVLRMYCTDKSALLVTTDYDWTRYVSDSVHWLPGDEPESKKMLSERMGFEITSNNIVMLKALFGDESDNIPAVAPQAMQAGFNALCTEVSDAELLPLLACKNENIERFPVLEFVRKNERQYRINLQLVNAIKVADNHIKAATVYGRDSAIALKAVREALDMTDSGKSGFVFGNIRRPRV